MYMKTIDKEGEESDERTSLYIEEDEYHYI